MIRMYNDKVNVFIHPKFIYYAKIKQKHKTLNKVEEKQLFYYDFN